jgi:hypothetical protein
VWWALLWTMHLRGPSTGFLDEMQRRRRQRGRTLMEPCSAPLWVYGHYLFSSNQCALGVCAPLARCSHLFPSFHATLLFSQFSSTSQNPRVDWRIEGLGEVPSPGIRLCSKVNTANHHIVFPIHPSSVPNACPRQRPENTCAACLARPSSAFHLVGKHREKRVEGASLANQQMGVPKHRTHERGACTPVIPPRRL